MVKPIDKFINHLTMSDVWDITEHPENWFFTELRDNEGKIIEARAWAAPEDWPTLEFLLRCGFSEEEARERLNRSGKLELLLEYWGTPLAPKAAARFPEVAMILEKIK